MKRGFSLYLDAIRVLAAIAVLVSHLGYDHVSGGRLAWARDWNIGSDAVVVFFVLSGLLISHTASSKDRNVSDYALARISRLWSVSIPALAFSLALGLAGAAAAPDKYPGMGLTELLKTSLQSIVFSNYIWFSAAHLPANNPFWSVTYEFWYYVGFGIATYWRDRWRLYGLAFVALLVGPRLLLLLPCWLLGVAVQRLLQHEGVRNMKAAVGAAFFVLPVLAYLGSEAVHTPAFLTHITSVALGGRDPNPILGFSDEFLWNFVLSLFTAAHFVGAAAIGRDGNSVPAGLESLIRWLSARTFSLYLFHMPLVVFVSSRPSYDEKSAAHLTFLTTAVFLGSFAMAEVSELRLGWWRTRLSTGFSRISRQFPKGR